MSQQHSQQQQQTCLQDIVEWDVDQCKENLQPALSYLLDLLIEEPHNSTILGVLSGKLVSAVPLELLEDKLLSKLVPQLQGRFDECMKQFTQATDAQEVIVAAIEECALLLSLTEQCIVSLPKPSASASTAPIQFSHVHSLPPLVLHMLEGSIVFCKESEEVYATALFASLSEQLSKLFYQTTRLAKVFLELLQVLVMDSVSDLPIVLSGVHHVCQLVADLDIKLSAQSLKVIAKLSTKYSSLLKEDQSQTIRSIITALCADASSTMEYIASSKSQEAPSSSTVSSHARVAEFKVKVIANLVDTFSQQTPTEDVINMLGVYHRNMSNEFSTTMQKLLMPLVQRQEFCIEILSVSAELSKFPKARLQLLMDITTAVCASEDKVVDLWMAEADNTHSLLYASLLMAQKGGKSLLLLSSGSTSGVYKRCCCLLSALAARTAPQHFSHVEKSLLEMVLSSSFVASLLAGDIWAFLARYSTVDVCMAQCVCLCQILQSAASLSPVPSLGRILALLRRLAKFLPPQKQEELVSMFPLSEPDNLVLWRVLPLSDEHLASVTAQCKQQLETIAHQGYLTPTDNIQLTSLLPICQPDSLMIHAAVEVLAGSRCLPSCLSAALVSMLASCTSKLSKQQQEKVLRVSCGDPAVGVAMLRYLRSQIHQPSTLAVCDALSTLLLSSVPSISLDARAVFADYAGLTQHEAIVTQCVHASSKVHDMVVKYFNQLTGTEEAPEVTVERLQEKEEAEEEELDYSPLPIKWYNKNEKKSSASVPSPPTPVPEEALDVILDLQNSIKALKQLKVPRQAKSTLEDMRDTLTGTVDKL